MLIKNNRTIIRSYKFRLYPTKEHEKSLLWTMEKCRFVYNLMLDRALKQDCPDRNSLQNSLPRLKEEYPDLKKVYSKVLQYEIHRLFYNLKGLSKSKKKGKKHGKLRFKSKNCFKTIHYNQFGFKIISTNSRLNKLHLSKIGDIPFKMHRTINGKIKQVIIKKYPSDRWYALVIIDTEISINHLIKNTIGIDVGIKYFLTDSKGRQIENPHNLGKKLKRLRINQKKLSRKEKNSNGWVKQKKRVALLHEKIVNQRDDFLHKLSKFYINNYDILVIEDLNIQKMIRNKIFSQYISDASWNKFIQNLSYKAESAGKIILRIDPRNTSKIYKYGNNLDRDYNAALNILERGLQKLVGMGHTEFTPVDIRPLQNLISVSASQVVESGSCLKDFDKSLTVHMLL